MKLYDSGVYLVNGKEIMTDATEAQQKTGKAVTKEQAAMDGHTYLPMEELTRRAVYLLGVESSQVIQLVFPNKITYS